eukprot:TRINITY_DN6515_c0_g3_i1.p1 TRINITY_DN6515_c0_g3~~TRINITY_DN6515_c0_g3_i1.p1  ORF type:complete len:288 (+),score=48.53 TRINITY_DN6515_c0_g3_i1:82-945(+)
MASLVYNRYGKSKVRILKVDKNPGRHVVHDYEVECLLEGDFEDSYTTGNNEKIIATDTIKNTCYVIANTNTFSSPEEYSIILAKHFLSTYSWVERVHVNVAVNIWQRLKFDKEGEQQHSFVKASPEIRTVAVNVTRSDVRVTSGVKNLVMLNTTESGFVGFHRDKYTTLKETTDRIFSTSCTLSWDFYTNTNKINYNKIYNSAKSSVFHIFAHTYSSSVQQTQLLVAQEFLKVNAEVSEMRLVMPNIHAFEVNLAPFDLENKGTLFQPTSEPSGLIESTVKRNASKL